MEPDATTHADPSHEAAAPGEDATAAGEDAVVFYWRPGCIFCVMLRRSLDRRGIPLEARNIWQEPAAAAEVRSVAGGNETVPTVAVGGRFLVNPSPRAVERLVAEVAPDLLG